MSINALALEQNKVGTVRLLDLNEIFTCEVTTKKGYKYYSVDCDIKMVPGQGTQKGKNGIVTKKHDCKNATKPEYTELNQWLFVYEENIYNLSAFRKYNYETREYSYRLGISIPNCSNAIKFHDEKLTPEIVEELKNHFMTIDYIKNTLTVSKAITERVSDYYQDQQNQVQDIKNKLFDLGIDGIKKHIKNVGSWEINKISKENTFRGNYLYISYSCKFEGLSLYSLSFNQSENIPSKLTQKQKEIITANHRQVLGEKLESMVADDITITLDKDKNHISIHLKQGSTSFMSCTSVV